MEFKNLPKCEKPREKLLRDGVRQLSNTELLTILLSPGTPQKNAMDLAADVLALDSSGLYFLSHCSPEELQRPEGMGEAKACVLLAAAELGRRIASSRPQGFRRVKNAEDIASLYMEKLRYYQEEHFFCLQMDGKGTITEEREISVGGLASTDAGPREVFTGAIRRCAGSLVFLHNHPSGDPTPSQEDVQVTRRLTEVGELVGIPVLDHLVIGDGIYVSMRGLGLM